MGTLITIPQEIMNLICDKLDLQTLLSLTKVNKHFDRTISVFMKIIKYCEKNKNIYLYSNKYDKFLSFVSQHIDYILIVKEYVRHLNMIDVCSRFGRNDKLFELKNKFPEIKGTCNAFNWASKNGHNDTLMLLKREFPEIHGTSYAFDLASENGHNDTLMLLKNEFPEIHGTVNAVIYARENNHIDTLELLKREFSLSLQ